MILILYTLFTVKYSIGAHNKGEQKMNNEANTVGTDVETLVIEGTEWLRKDVADKRIEELEFIVGALYGYYQLITPR